MIDLRKAADILIGLAEHVPSDSLSFRAGGAAALEVLKLCRNSASKEWKDGETPTLPETPITLSGVLVTPAIQIEQDWLYISVEGVPMAGIKVHVSSGSMAGGLRLFPEPPVLKTESKAILPARRR